MLTELQIKQLVEDIHLYMYKRPFDKKTLSKDIYLSQLRQMVYKKDNRSLQILEDSDTDYEGEQYVIFEFNEQIYRLDYQYTSYGGLDFDYAQVFTVTKTVETVITYKRDPSIYDMSLKSLRCRADKIVDIKEVKAIYDNTELSFTLECGLVVLEQVVTNLSTTSPPTIGGYLVNVANQWLYFGLEYEQMFKY